MSKTRIIEAVRKLDLESIKKLLDDNPSLLSVTDRMGRNLLHLACSAQCKELNVPESVSARVATLLLNRGLDVESPLVTSDGCDTVNAGLCTKSQIENARVSPITSRFLRLR